MKVVLKGSTTRNDSMLLYFQIIRLLLFENNKMSIFILVIYNLIGERTLDKLLVKFRVN